ncbi:MAG: hypothetical protein D6741_19635, partial [Planctomycetota bacterium]
RGQTLFKNHWNPLGIRGAFEFIRYETYIQIVFSNQSQKDTIMSRDAASDRNDAKADSSAVENKNKKTSRIRLIVFVAAVLVGLALAVGVSAFAWRKSTVDELTQLKQQWEASGEPMTLADLAPPPVPDEENAWFILKQNEQPLSGLLGKLENSYAPAPIEDDRLTDYGRKAWPPLFAGSGDLRKAFARAAACRDYRADLPYDGTTVDFLQRCVGSGQLLRNAARYARALAIYHYNIGEREEGLQAALDLLKIATAAADQPGLMGYLNAVAAQEVAIRYIALGLGHDPIPEELAVEIDQTLARVEPRKAFIAAAKADRVIGWSMLQHGREDESWLDETTRLRYQIAFLKLVDEFVAEVERGDYQSLATMQLVDSLPEDQDFAKITMPAYETAAEHAFRVEALAHAARILLAMHQSADAKQQSGKVERAMMLQLGVPNEAVTDPFSGGDMIVVRSGDDWFVYSVGPNGVDDGGKITGREPADIGFEENATIVTDDADASDADGNASVPATESAE